MSSSYFDKNDYTFVKFQKSAAKYKKYAAILESKKTGRHVRINFGDVRYQQFRDATGLRLYERLDHGDNARRDNYRARHKPFIKKGYYSAGYFSYKYLW